MDEKIIARINALAKKAKESGLTREEEAEREELRAAYIAAFRQGMRNTMENVYIVDGAGNKQKVERKPKA